MRRRVSRTPVSVSFEIMRFAHHQAYVAKLGAALYTFQYVEWVIIEILGNLRPDRNVRWSAGQTSGQIARALQDTLVTMDDPADLGTRWVELTQIRDDIVHSRPATDPLGRQRLYRWAPTRQALARFITDEALDKFTSDLEAISRLAEGYRRSMRASVQPNLADSTG
jgi:hypothetical protein